MSSIAGMVVAGHLKKQTKRSILRAFHLYICHGGWESVTYTSLKANKDVTRILALSSVRTLATIKAANTTMRMSVMMLAINVYL